MNNHIKRVEELTVEDLEAFPVWEYTNEGGDSGETAVRPVEVIPVENLENKLVGAQVLLASGSTPWALLGNVSSNNSFATQHFLAISIFHKGKCFHLARYHDVDSDKRGPIALSKFLKIPIQGIFPISYDLRKFSMGDAAALVGNIPEKPNEKLTDDQLVRLALM